MTCTVNFVEKPKLNNPILIEGLPGIGLVANIAVAYLIKRLNAKFFAKISSSSFPDISVADKRGAIKSPFCKLYYHKTNDKEKNDLVFAFGNSQSLTRRGQYEFCGSILDSVESLGCNFVITLGGYRPGKKDTEYNLYFASSDVEVSQTLSQKGVKILEAQIYGVAGLLVGLASLRNMKGFCLLVETPGNILDVEAAKVILGWISEHLNLDFNSKGLTDPEELADFLSPFDFGALSKQQREETLRPSWFI